MSDWEVAIKQVLEHEKVVRISGDEFKSQEDANKYVAEALNNVPFDWIENYITFDTEEYMTIEGENPDYWLED